MGYRETWFKNNEPDKNGKYTCVKCNGQFEKFEIDIDHKIPKRKGGLDELWNLQCTCRHCNRSKGKNQTFRDTTTSILGATFHGDLIKLILEMTSRKIKDISGEEYKR